MSEHPRHAGAPENGKKPWRRALHAWLEPASLRMLALGFVACVPNALILGVLGWRLRKAGIDRADIGFIALVGLAYAFKWAWAPLVDASALPWLTRRLGQRRSWMLLAQVLVMAGLAGMALGDPQTSLWVVVASAILVAFASATQDVALDAYRIESADASRQAIMSAMYQYGWRIGMVWTGAGALYLASLAESDMLSGYQQAAWRLTYLVMAASMLVGVVTVLLCPEPVCRAARPTGRTVAQWLDQVVVAPFRDFFASYGRRATVILLLIAVYRISDVLMNSNLVSAFYVDMGYEEKEIATIARLYGNLMSAAGIFAGGVFTMRLGVMRVLMAGAFLSAASNLLFAWLGTRGHDVPALVLAISVDNFASGLATTAFVAYLSSLTDIRYTATQYAALSSIMLLLPKVLSSLAGTFVNAFGYPVFFVMTALVGVPVLLLVWLAGRGAARSGGAGQK